MMMIVMMTMLMAMMMTMMKFNLVRLMKIARTTASFVSAILSVAFHAFAQRR